MLLRGYPPSGDPELSYVGSPTGSYVGQTDVSSAVFVTTDYPRSPLNT